jgi:hypothetical protein
VKTYIAIDKLHSTVTDDCSTSAEAMGYIIRFDRAWGPNREDDTIEGWREYMARIGKLTELAPNFTQWDKQTRKIERLARAAVTESDRVLGEHISADKVLPEQVEKGMYARIGLLQRWTKNHLETVRATDDYKKWRAENDALLQSPQRMLLL